MSISFFYRGYLDSQHGKQFDFGSDVAEWKETDPFWQRLEGPSQVRIALILSISCSKTLTFG